MLLVPSHSPKRTSLEKICFCYMGLKVRQVLETNLRGKRIAEDIKEGWFDRKHKIYFDGKPGTKSQFLQKNKTTIMYLIKMW